jgi:formamidopyrimidine-DNA glycosylase
MPELPEVETIRRNLRLGTPSLLGKTIRRAEVMWQRSLEGLSPDDFQARLTGQVIQEINRRGKFLIFNLSQGALIFHLRMSGDLWIEAADAPLAPHHRLVIFFEDPYRLSFNDARKFGRAWLVGDPSAVVGSLGPEPLDPSLGVREFYERLHQCRRQLKPLLLDQKFLAGLGNIYTDEALHLARLHPLLISDRIDEVQASVLLDSIRQVLDEGIQRNGASIDWVYRGGDFQNYFRVYQRTGEPCKQCGTLIERIKLGQRSTHFCPYCQQFP